MNNIEQRVLDQYNKHWIPLLFDKKQIDSDFKDSDSKTSIHTEEDDTDTMIMDYFSEWLDKQEGV